MALNIKNISNEYKVHSKQLTVKFNLSSSDKSDQSIRQIPEDLLVAVVVNRNGKDIAGLGLSRNTIPDLSTKEYTVLLPTKEKDYFTIIFKNIELKGSEQKVRFEVLDLNGKKLAEVVKPIGVRIPRPV